MMTAFFDIKYLLISLLKVSDQPGYGEVVLIAELVRLASGLAELGTGAG